MQLGAQLKNARQKLGVTQEIVAVELHVSRQTISSWENERSYPDIASLIALSDYYQLSLDELLKEDNGMVDDLARKERALKEAQRIWLMSFIVNLLLLLLTLANVFSLFGVKMNGFMLFTVVLITLLNGYLLLTASYNYWHLKPDLVLQRTKRKWHVVFAVVVIVVLIFVAMQRVFLALGTIVGVLVGLICVYFYRGR